jgi:hypothetical protein
LSFSFSERDFRVPNRPASVGAARTDICCVRDNLPVSAGNASSSEKLGRDDCTRNDGHGRGRPVVAALTTAAWTDPRVRERVTRAYSRLDYMVGKH